MKIIIDNADLGKKLDIERAVLCIQSAINEYKIEQGAYNFIPFTFTDGTQISVVRNKKSYTAKIYKGSENVSP